MLADLRWPSMGQYRGYLTLAVTPIQWFVDAPNRFLASMDESLEDRETLQQQNQKLQADLLILARKLQRMEALTTENGYLRGLLNAAEKIDERVELAELIGVNPNPFIHQIIINKGLQNQVYLGQPVLDADGVMGQVVEVGPYTSRVLMITDSQHAVPVQVNRSGFRSLLLGKGSLSEMVLDHVPDTADIKVGDMLISSGLAQRFPTGYPVAVVT
ncbi:MAG: rod shape-determining protein MreC, partial [Motiliproteus sp.]|nr:rod shape-determining protein MreC [Motiliproteus sp.]